MLNKKVETMRKVIVFMASLALIAFVALVAKVNEEENLCSNLAVSDVEALSTCESGDGYPMDRYCIPSPGSRCYVGEFVAKDCISNLV